MNKKVLSDLEKMNKDRAKAEKEYAEQREEVLEVHRIMNEGIQSTDELSTYLIACIEDAKHMEDLARANNNNILYSEAVGIRREFTKLVKLLMVDEININVESAENMDGTEESHRANNEGEEGYV
jgi:hypothetical protein